MSRVGKQPIVIPDQVKAVLTENQIRINGPKGTLALTLDDHVVVKIEDGKIFCLLKEDSQGYESRHGLMRSMIFNLVKGCSQGFVRELEIVGVGYRAAVKDRTLELLLGYSHPILYDIPEGIMISVDAKQTRLVVSGADAKQVGQTAAEIRGFRKPEPYKGKGIKYFGEVIRRKAGKAQAGTTAA